MICFKFNRCFIFSIIFIFSATPCQILPGFFDFLVKNKLSLPTCFSNSWSDEAMALKRRQKIKEASRIPGVPVGAEVETSEGKKKKVCFHIGGKFFFRMVDPGWHAPGRPLHKPKSRRSKTKRKEKKGDD
jgi:hypothetical protein